MCVLLYILWAWLEALSSMTLLFCLEFEALLWCYFQCWISHVIGGKLIHISNWHACRQWREMGVMRVWCALQQVQHVCLRMARHSLHSSLFFSSLSHIEGKKKCTELPFTLQDQYKMFYVSVDWPVGRMKASSEKEKTLPAQQVTTTWVGKSRVLLRNLRVIFHPTLRCIVSLVRDWRLIEYNKAEVVCIHQQYDILPTRSFWQLLNRWTAAFILNVWKTVFLLSSSR